jgi:hypothetical protein
MDSPTPRFHLMINTNAEAGATSAVTTQNSEALASP